MLQIAVKRYLLDTHLLYWWMTACEPLGKATQGLVATSKIVMSTASVRERVLDVHGSSMNSSKWGAVVRGRPWSSGR